MLLNYFQYSLIQTIINCDYKLNLCVSYAYIFGRFFGKTLFQINKVTRYYYTMDLLKNITVNDKVLLVWSELGSNADKLQSTVSSIKVFFLSTC